MVLSEAIVCRRSVPYVLVGLMTVGLAGRSVCESLSRYREFNSAWPWDLAHNNQWLWAVTHGIGTHTIRPWATFATEGPSVWKSNHLDPIRLVALPFYMLNPEPRTLLVLQCIIVWGCVPASFALVRHESGSILVALSAAALVPLTPLLRPLILNDFRDIQLGLPFVLVAVDGYRGRKIWLTALGIAWILACRQEYALVVASLAVVPPRRAEDSRRTRRWMLAVVTTGLVWTLIYVAYLGATAGPPAPALYLDQFSDQPKTAADVAHTAIEFLLVGLGAWAALALLVPRLAATLLPWLWFLSRGLFGPEMLATPEWRKVRYAAPLAGLGLAAGLVGYARLGRWLLDRGGAKRYWLLATAWMACALGLALAHREVSDRMSRIPKPMSRTEAEQVWRWVEQVGPDDGVLATYTVAAPLSSRRLIFSYLLELNYPPGFPALEPAFRWAFVGRGEMPPRILTSQGFSLVHAGETMWIFRRQQATR